MISGITCAASNFKGAPVLPSQEKTYFDFAAGFFFSVELLDLLSDLLSN
jgi:hypothetical protein